MTATLPRPLLFASLIAVCAVAGSLLFGAAPARAAVKDCDDNAIIRCGLNDANPVEDFIAKYVQNAPGDLDDIYNFNGYQLDNLRINKDRVGYVTKEGNVYLKDKLVATGAMSLGRQPRPNGSATTHNGRTYYYSSTKDSFRSDRIPAIVVMNGDKFIMAILTSCGNPVVAQPTGRAPEYSCNSLRRTKIDNQTFEFSTKATALHGAVISKVVYDFGDGTTAERADPAEKVRHAYATPGEYTAKVTVYVTVNGVTFPVDDICSKPVEAKALPAPQPPKPVYACTNLTARQIDGSRAFEFTASAQAEHGAVLRSADFDFDDNTTADDMAPTAANQVTLRHEFSEPGNYTVQATLRFNVGNDVKSDSCQVRVTAEQAQTPPAAPAATSGKLQPVAQNTGTSLPNTGPAEAAAGVLGIGSIAAASYYYTGSRRNLRKTLNR